MAAAFKQKLGGSTVGQVANYTEFANGNAQPSMTTGFSLAVLSANVLGSANIFVDIAQRD